MSVATDESFVDKTGNRVDRTEWHRLVTFQDGLIDMLERHARKGRLIHVEGKLQTRRWKKDGEQSERFSTEILVVPGHKLQFLDKAPAASGTTSQTAQEPARAPSGGEAGPDTGADDTGAETPPF